MGIAAQTSIHVVLVGWDPFAERVLEQLLAADLSVTVVVQHAGDQHRVDRLFGPQCTSLLVPNLTDLKLLEPTLSQAQIILVNLGDDREKLIYVVNLRKHFPHLKIVAPVTNPNLKETFVSAAEVLPLSKEEVSGKVFASYLFERDVAEYLNDLLSPAQLDNEHDIQEYLLPAGHPYIGKRYGDLFVELKKSYNAVLIGVSQRTDEGYHLNKNPPDDTLFAEGDYLIVVLSGRAAALMQKDAFSEAQA